VQAVVSRFTPRMVVTREELRGTSERDAHASLGGAEPALVGHQHAFDGAEHRDIGADVIVEARARQHADRAALAGRGEADVLPEPLSL
jgi:hypothetical protein